MLVAIDKLGEKKYAHNVQKGIEVFCPECKGRVMLKKGTVRIPHFAHIPPSYCSNGTGETERHMEIKLGIFKALQSRVNCLEMEYSIGHRRADIYFEFNGNRVVIEVQNSNISTDEIWDRVSDYNLAGCVVLWVLNADMSLKYKNVNEISDKEHRLPGWILYLHKLFFGVIFLHMYDSILKPAHFSPILRDGGEMYDDEGSYISFAPRYVKSIKNICYSEDDIDIMELIPITNKLEKLKILGLPFDKRFWKDKYEAM